MQETNTTLVEYTRWVIGEAGAERVDNFLLLSCLNNIEFYFLMPDDKNRAEDAFYIREDYISEHGDIEEIPSTPTVLEVLLGLAKHATVMDYDTAWKWLSLFIRNLGFEGINDSNWNENTEAFVKKTIRKWLDRRFSKDGVGSPFRGNGTYDVAHTSMWYSLQWYLSNEFGEGHI